MRHVPVPQSSPQGDGIASSPEGAGVGRPFPERIRPCGLTGRVTDGGNHGAAIRKTAEIVARCPKSAKRSSTENKRARVNRFARTIDAGSLSLEELAGRIGAAYCAE